MAVQERIQDNKQDHDNILLVSPLLFNRNVTMSEIRNPYYCKIIGI
jgi:hypothetical protein